MLHAGTAFVSSCCISQTPFHTFFSILPKQPSSASSHGYNPVLCDLLSLWCQWHLLLKTTGQRWEVTCNTAWVHHEFAHMTLLTRLNSGCMINYRKIKLFTKCHTKTGTEAGLASLSKGKCSYILPHVPAATMSLRRTTRSDAPAPLRLRLPTCPGCQDSSHITSHQQTYSVITHNKNPVKQQYFCLTCCSMLFLFNSAQFSRNVHLK